MTHFLFEKVLPVLEGAQLDLSLFVLQLHIGQLEIGDEVVEGLEHLFDGQRDHCPILQTEAVQVSGRKRQRVVEGGGGIKAFHSSKMRVVDRE